MKLSYPYFNTNTLKRVEKILKSGRVNYWTGDECKRFEKEFSEYLGNKHSVALSNGSVALELALRSLKLKKGDKIIVSPRSFIISASCVCNLGLEPIFSDVDDNGNIDIEGIKKIYSRKIKAIIVVHLNGLSCDMDPILKFTKKNKIFLIEDCSQAHGAIYKGKKVGSFGHLSTWSFCQDKIISTGGEGGMISTNNTNLWLKIWSLKDHGKSYKNVFNKKHNTGFKWLHDDFGSNYRMTEIQAAIGREQLKSLDKQIKKRNLIAKLYLYELNDFYTKYDIIKEPSFIDLIYNSKKKLSNSKKYTHAFYRLNLFLNKKKVDQKEIIQILNSYKINCGVGACPEIYREKIFKKLKLSPKKRLINAKILGETSIMFPINPYKPLDKIRSEIKVVKKILKKYL